MIYVLYHASCYDGFCAAYVCWQVFGDEATYIPVQYGQPLPELETGSRVYIVDFSYSKEQLMQLCREHREVYVFDHHNGVGPMLTEYAWPSNMTVRYDPEISGARITYDFFKVAKFFPFLNTRWLVNYTEDRDLWKWELVDSRVVSAGLRTWDLDFRVWSTITREECVQRGQLFTDYFNKLIKGAIKKAVLVEYDTPNGPLTIPTVNCTLSDIISDVAGGLALENEDGLGCTFFIDVDGRRVVSIRSRTPRGFNAQDIAKHNGGNGHPNAAGFKL